VKSLSLDQFELLPKRPDWTSGLRECWNASEDGAQSCLEEFINNGLHGYAQKRDFPARRNVSRLSPFLRFGMVSPYQVWHSARHSDAPIEDVAKFLKELAWREFAYHLLFHFPETGWKNFNPDFDRFPFRNKPDNLKAWQRGKTGFPLVDAGMRELWRTGYMHNRVRMVAASFLVKHLLIDWREGERWFWETLVDGDPANNAAGWQWVAGSGADAAPYFRIFNPVTQGEKFDPSGSYVSKWIPELSQLPLKYLHAPWQAPAEVLKAAGVTPGKTSPHPIVDHQYARTRALQAFAAIRKDSSA
jgi:deoxyribodipyrimidine photo-lyase